MRLTDRVRRWYLRRWVNGSCYICDAPATSRFAATHGPAIDLRACAKHEEQVRALAVVAIRDWTAQQQEASGG
jgi:hypothetical protein